jgi:hypothetical protein
MEIKTHCGTISAPNEQTIKTFTLIDKFQNHLVFVNWNTREWITFETNDDVDEYKVGKDYDIKLPITSKT